MKNSLISGLIILGISSVVAVHAKLPKNRRYHFALQKIERGHVNLLEDAANIDSDWRVCSPNIVLQFGSGAVQNVLEVYDGVTFQCKNDGNKITECQINTEISSPIGMFDYEDGKVVAKYSHDVLNPEAFIKHFEKIMTQSDSLQGGTVQMPSFYRLPQETRRTLCDMHGKMFDSVQTFSDKSLLSLPGKPSATDLSRIFVQTKRHSLWRVRPRREKIPASNKMLISERLGIRMEVFRIDCLPIVVRSNGHSNCELENSSLFLKFDSERFNPDTHYNRKNPPPFSLHDDPSCSDVSSVSKLRIYDEDITFETPEELVFFDKLPNYNKLAEDGKKTCKYSVLDSEFGLSVALPFSRMSSENSRVYVDFHHKAFALAITSGSAEIETTSKVLEGGKLLEDDVRL